MENFSDFYQLDLKHAFSTKIADSLASGTCLFVYAPENIALSSYLKENGVACVVSDKENLEKELRNIISDSGLRERYVTRAIKLAIDKFNAEKNLAVFSKIICNVCNGKWNAIKYGRNCL